MSAPVLLAASGVAEIELLHALESAPEFTVTRRCADGPELLASAQTGAGALAIITAEFCLLDVDFLSTITATDCAVILLVTGPEHAPLARVATEMGIAVAGDVNETLAAARTWIEQEAARSASSQTLDGVPSRGGKLLAVWGPAGAPGRTRMAIEIAHQLADANERTLLIDADPYGGVIASALGLLDEASGLIAATRAAGRGDLSADDLLRHAVGLGPNLRLLVGIPRPDRWPELAPVALSGVWQEARNAADWSVIDCGFSLETDEELMYDTHAPQRNAATLSALENADVVLVVGQADPVQIPRLVRGLGELREAVNPDRVLVAVTRVRATVAGNRAEESIAEILHRYANVPAVELIPEDQSAFDAALLAGKTVTETASDSAALQALARLAERIRALETAAP